MRRSAAPPLPLRAEKCDASHLPGAGADGGAGLGSGRAFGLGLGLAA
ncbi:hypothetical protein LP420_29770 [Massilia sp. B-10]|nr:hypothetical protein LP420_29770 [Massilia sp. B-10]